jgi:hypothetical protein
MADDIIQYSAWFAGLALAWILARLLKTIEKKFNIEIPDEWEKKLFEHGGLLDQSIAYAEEQAHKQFKDGVPKMLTSTKLETALGYLADLGAGTKIADLSKAKLEKLVEARLGANRI